MILVYLGGREKNIFLAPSPKSYNPRRPPARYIWKSSWPSLTVRRAISQLSHQKIGNCEHSSIAQERNHIPLWGSRPGNEIGVSQGDANDKGKWRNRCGNSDRNSARKGSKKWAKLTELNSDLFVHVWKMSEECKTLALVVHLACESIRFFGSSFSAGETRAENTGCSRRRLFIGKSVKCMIQ